MLPEEGASLGVFVEVEGVRHRFDERQAGCPQKPRLNERKGGSDPHLSPSSRQACSATKKNESLSGNGSRACPPEITRTPRQLRQTRHRILVILELSGIVGSLGEPCWTQASLGNSPMVARLSQGLARARSVPLAAWL